MLSRYLLTFFFPLLAGIPAACASNLTDSLIALAESSFDTLYIDQLFQHGMKVELQTFVGLNL